MRWHHRLGLIFNAQVTDLASHIVPVRLVCVGSVTLSAAIVGKNTSLMAGLVSLAIGLLLYCAAESFIRSVNTLANPAMKLLVSLFVAVAVGCLLPRSLKPEAFQFGGDRRSTPTRAALRRSLSRGTTTSFSSPWSTLRVRMNARRTLPSHCRRPGSGSSGCANASRWPAAGSRRHTSIKGLPCAPNSP